MTESFNRPGAVDLTSLKPAAAPHSGSFVEQITQANFEKVIAKSMKHPVILEFTSSRAEGAAGLSQALTELAAEAQGKFLLGRIDIDSAPEIAQALQIQAVPVVVAVIGGQLAPLFQGVQPKSSVVQVLDQVYQAAVANGIVGRAEPVAPTEGTEPTEVVDPRLEPAFSAMEAGDFAKAVTEFDQILAATPNDATAKSGRAQAGLIVRTQNLDPEELSSLEPHATSTALVLADVEMVQGRTEAAFARLLVALAEAEGDEKESLRLRILEFFDILGPTDPAVVKARRRLTTLLF